MIRYFTACAAAARSTWFWFALLASLSFAGPLSWARAGITPTGDVSPDNPSTWTVFTAGYIGNTSSGTLTVDAGSGLLSNNGSIGYGSAATGVVNVAGTKSSWNVGELGGSLYVGNSGSGSLAVTNGGGVSGGRYSNGYIGYSPGSIGVVNVAGSGSTWTVSGGGSGGMFDGINVGHSGSGTLSISNGGSVGGVGTFTDVEVGYDVGSAGVVNVDGRGSTLTYTGRLQVGNYGSGTLSITNGGTASTNVGSADIGYNSGSAGVVTVDGTGSMWTNQISINIGLMGSGTLSISGGGAATAGYMNVSNSTSLLAVDVGRGSVIKVGTGTMSNNGTIRILAGAGVAADGTKYSPISATTWNGSGTYQAVGGTWSSTGHTFTASSITPGTSGTPVPLELATVQRAIVDDNGPGGTNWEVGASFVAATSTMNISFTATAMDSATLDILRADLPANESILSGWTFATTNYTVSPTNPIYFSFNVGAGHPANDLDLWHFDGSTWTEYSPTDLTYDGTYASFTATGLSGYAMVAVPEPGTLALLAAGLIGLLAYAWRRRQAT